MNKNNQIKNIEKLSSSFGVSGFEDEVVSIVKDIVKDYCSTDVDSMNNLYLYLNNNQEHKKTIMIDAHSDEVGFIIQAIKDNGMMTFLPLGGIVPSNICAHEVWIKNCEGQLIRGIVASKPPHFMTDAEKNVPISIANLVIDVGATSKEEVIKQYGIKIGSPVIPKVEFSYNSNTDMMIGKAFDCRIGVAALTETLKELSQETLKVNVIGTLSAQEEVGDRGIITVMNNVTADIAIVFEGCPADDSFQENYLIQAGLKKGPMIRHIDRSIIATPRFMNYTIDLAKKYNLKLQESVRSGGGNNGSIIITSKKGIPTIVIGIPVRYIHSHYGICAYEDYLEAIKLACNLVKSLDDNVIESIRNNKTN